MTFLPVFRFSFQRLALLLSATLMIGSAVVDRAADAVPTRPGSAVAQAAAPSQPLTLRANSTVANAKTGVVVARGNVQINYPSRQIQATAAQAVFFSKENRIVLTGNVYVLQQGNSLRGETITYLVNEGRFEALPDSNKQVEAIYLVQDVPPVPPAAPSAAAPTAPPPAAAAPFDSKPQFQTPASTKR
ncbi:LptA/OstA family protein [Phormidesmis sp. 146-35]